MALSKDEAIALLSREVPVDQQPVLSEGDLDDLVAHMAMPDGGYSAVWLNFAAAKAWERKAGRVAGLVTFSADGATFNAGDLHRQAIRMQRSYLSRCAGTAGSTP